MFTRTHKTIALLAAVAILAVAVAIKLFVASPAADSDACTSLKVEKDRYCKNIVLYLNALDSISKIKGAWGLIIHSQQYCTGHDNPDLIGDVIMSGDEQAVRAALEQVKRTFDAP